MTATQQHALDSLRALQRGEGPPISPGAGDLQALREFRTWWRFRAVVGDLAEHRRTSPGRVLRRAFLRGRSWIADRLLKDS
ncbi:hypothetical protein [Streptomyces pinistramenti]|uniref:hypothetical protein n=1 Tax=Streptomyces pinistramenti TaxID=2884812 RepID=UPI001D082BD9|nr:hypothetical protein [Streptomyces pinistramenti]MCB5906292.1 hypothetical protein [Streptomyces pinistramenti]